MERCENCNVPGQERPLYTRITMVEGEMVCLLFCSRCQAMSNEELRRKIHLWLPPYDRRMMGVGA
jgi:hypothetical protein